MNELLDQVLGIIRDVKDDTEKLQIILDFLENEIVEEDNYSPIDEVPKKYKPLISEIAELIDTGMLCFLNPKTDELDYIPQDLYNELDFFDENEEIKEHLKEYYGWETAEFIDWERYIEFEPLPSHESFKIMEAFAMQLSDDEKLRPQLINALRHHKPFANFNHIIHNSHLREEWFAYKQRWIEEEVARQLLVKLEKYKENGEI
jgi:hypothetical protein